MLNLNNLWIITQNGQKVHNKVFLDEQDVIDEVIILEEEDSLFGDGTRKRRGIFCYHRLSSQLDEELDNARTDSYDYGYADGLQDGDEKGYNRARIQESEGIL